MRSDYNGVSLFYAKDDGGFNAFDAVDADHELTADLGYFAVFSAEFTINVDRQICTTQGNTTTCVDDPSFNAAGTTGSFVDIQEWIWEGSETAQTRIDCVIIGNPTGTSSINGTNLESEVGSCSVDTPSEVPLPAGVLLLATGLFGLGVVRKRAA